MATGCLSELELDRLLADDPAPELRARLAACEHCQTRLTALTVEQRAQMTPEHVARQTDAILARMVAPQPARRWPRWATMTAASALAAAAALVLLWPRVSPDATGGAIRIKGGQRFDVVLAGPDPRILADGEAVPVGATLSFRAACPGGCAVALFAVTADGIDVLADAVPPPWPVDEPALLPVSAVVDGTAGDDTIVALLCTSPPSIDTMLAALRGGQPSVPGCDLRRHHLRRGP